jgi:hypothetical protein
LHNRKIKLPKEVKHAPEAKLHKTPCPIKQVKLECHQTDFMSYSNFKTVSQAILTGTLTKEQFKRAQAEDSFCSETLKKVKKLKRFIVIEGLLFFKSYTIIELVLKVALLDMEIN